MDWRILTELGMGAAFAVIGFFARWEFQRMVSRLDKLETQMREAERYMERTYVTREDLTRLENIMTKRQDNIEIKLDRLHEKFDAFTLKVASSEKRASI